MKKAIFSVVLASIVFAPLTTIAADKKIVAYDKQITTLTKKIESLQKQLEALLSKREKRAAELEDRQVPVSGTGEKTQREILKIQPGDHVQGNPKAPVVVFVYTDFECPFCLIHHATMQRVLAEYKNKEKVALVYRHFPIEQLHPNANQIAEASECVASQTGDKGFWKFADKIFGSRVANSYTDMEKLDGYAVAAGAKKKSFQKCLAGKVNASIVSESKKQGEVLGINGTPQSFVVGGVGNVTVIPGAQPYSEVVKAIDAVFEKL